MRTLWVVLVGSLAAVVGFASTAHASATIDLIWGGGGATTSSVATSSTITLNVVLTAGLNGSQGAGVTVDYSAALAELAVVGFTPNPALGPELPLLLGSTVDTGSQVRNLNAAAFPPYVGPGLLAGQSYLIGTVMFHKLAGAPGTFAINAVTTGTDDILDLSGGVITGTSTFNGASLVNPPVPEPGTVTLLGLGLAGLTLVGRRRRS